MKVMLPNMSNALAMPTAKPPTSGFIGGPPRYPGMVCAETQSFGFVEVTLGHNIARWELPILASATYICIALRTVMMRRISRGSVSVASTGQIPENSQVGWQVDFPGGREGCVDNTSSSCNPAEVNSLQLKRKFLTTHLDGNPFNTKVFASLIGP